MTEAKTVAKGTNMQSWIGFTLSGLIGFLAAVVTMTLSFSDVAHLASAAHQRAMDNANDVDEDIRPRIRIIEHWRERESVHRDQMVNRLDAIREWQTQMTEELKAIRVALNR